MAEMEDKPLLAEPQVDEMDDVPTHPPPPYVHVDVEVTERPVLADPPVPPPQPPVKAPTGQAMPLPTYAQSEKYETEGVLDFNQKDTDDGGEETEDELPRTDSENVGTWCEFMLFFLICSAFSVVGFLISMCVATTVAAKGGAVAGLGIALAGKPIMFELYYDDSIVRSYCTSDTSGTCYNRFYTVVRFCIWVIGLFGLYLLLRGTTVFLKARKQATR